MPTDMFRCARLAAHLYALRTGQASLSAEEQAQAAHKTMWNLVHKYSDTLDHHTPSKPAQKPNNQVVVLTGATGALGSHMLNQLLAQSKVSRVYALVRAKDDDNAAERIKASHEQRYLPPLTNSQAERVVALASDLDKADLGLSADRYAEIQSSVTSVIAVRL